MGITRQPQEPQQPLQDEIKLNNPEKRLIRYFRQSSIEGRDAILNVAETMATMQGKREEENTHLKLLKGGLNRF